MGLVRTGVLIAAVVLMLPADERQQARLKEQALSAATWTVTYCDRNPAHCEKAGQAWDQFVAKAQFALKMAGDVYRQTSGGPQTVPAADPLPPPPAKPVRQAQHGTLTPDDLKTPWRGTAAR